MQSQIPSRKARFEPYWQSKSGGRPSKRKEYDIQSGLTHELEPYFYSGITMREAWAEVARRLLNPERELALEMLTVFVTDTSEIEESVDILGLPTNAVERFLYKPQELEREFYRHVEKWRDETGVLSSMTAKILHPSYLRIIGMGRQAIPLILREMEQRPSHWFWALQSITGENPVKPDADFDEAVRTWLAWGKEHGYLD